MSSAFETFSIVQLLKRKKDMEYQIFLVNREIEIREKEIREKEICHPSVHENNQCTESIQKVKIRKKKTIL